MMSWASAPLSKYTRRPIHVLSSAPFQKSFAISFMSSPPLLFSQPKAITPPAMSVPCFSARRDALPKPVYRSWHVRLPRESRIASKRHLQRLMSCSLFRGPWALRWDTYEKWNKIKSKSVQVHVLPVLFARLQKYESNI
jgi:hypothetical protein